MGKHYKIVSQILSDLKKLDQYSALKVESLKVGVKKADLRAAPHRAAQKKTCAWRSVPTISTLRVSPPTAKPGLSVMPVKGASSAAHQRPLRTTVAYVLSLMVLCNARGTLV